MCVSHYSGIPLSIESLVWVGVFLYIFQYPVFRLGRSQPPLCHQPRLCRASGDLGTYTEGHAPVPRSTHCPGTNLPAGLHLCGQSGVDLSAGPAHREVRSTDKFNKKKVTVTAHRLKKTSIFSHFILAIYLSTLISHFIRKTCSLVQSSNQPIMWQKCNPNQIKSCRYI